MRAHRARHGQRSKRRPTPAEFTAAAQAHPGAMNYGTAGIGKWSSVLVPTIDVTPELLAGLRCPLLFMGPTRCVKLSLEEARFWTDNAPDAELQMVDSASQSLFYANAQECADRTVEFLQRRFGRGSAAARPVS